MKNMKLLGMLSALIMSFTSITVAAACGDSVCGFQKDKYTCVVVTPGGGLKECTEESPCSVKCN